MIARPFSQSVKAIAAGTFCMIVLVTIMVLHAWPLWTGRVVDVPATVSITHDAFRGAGVAIAHPACRVVIGDPGAVAAPAGTIVLTPRGGWWDDVPKDARGRRQQMLGRVVYVQLGPVAGSSYMPVSISDAAAPGEINLKGRVASIESNGALRIDYGLEMFYTEEDRAQQAVTQLRTPGSRAEIRIAIASSGRARIKALLINGTEI